MNFRRRFFLTFTDTSLEHFFYCKIYEEQAVPGLAGLNEIAADLKILIGGSYPIFYLFRDIRHLMIILSANNYNSANPRLEFDQFAKLRQAIIYIISCYRGQALERKIIDCK